MKKYLSVLALALVSLSSAAAWAAATPVRSLNDLPSEWQGVAGDLFTRTPVTLKINRILGIDRRNEGEALSILYTVDASLQIGERATAVKSLWLHSYPQTGDNLEIYITLDDVLVQTLFVIVSYDEATNTFTMRDPIQNGARHLYLTGKAPHAL